MKDSVRSILTKAAQAIGHTVREDLTYEHHLVIEGGKFWNPLFDARDCEEIEAALSLTIVWDTDGLEVYRTGQGTLGEKLGRFSYGKSTRQTQRRNALVFVAAGMANQQTENASASTANASATIEIANR